MAPTAAQTVSSDTAQAGEQATKLGAMRPSKVVVEGESGHGDGKVMERSKASGDKTVHLSAGEARALPFHVASRARYAISVRYSNDNDNSQPGEQVDVRIDGVGVGSFTAGDTGDFGSGWNVFRSSGTVGSVRLKPGAHKATLTVSGGDGFGVEIDLVRLKPL